MKRDSRLSATLHLLLHLAEQADPIPSDSLARAMRTNPVVVRRLMAGLRRAGLVASEKGHGGGWRLVRALPEMTLLDVYRALGQPLMLAMGNRSDAPECLVEQAVNASLDTAFREAEATLIAHLEHVTLAQLNADFRARLSVRKEVCELEKSNAE